MDQKLPIFIMDMVVVRGALIGLPGTTASAVQPPQTPDFLFTPLFTSTLFTR